MASQEPLKSIASSVADSDLPSSTLDRRREQRQEADGDVSLFDIPAYPGPILGRLRDCSSGGFRASHDFALLKSGTILSFSHSGGSGRARVVWNRIADGKWESGFVVV